jgi:hypothetical protein
LRFAAAAAEYARFAACDEHMAILAVGVFGVAERGKRGAIGFVGAFAGGDGGLARGLVVLRDFGADLRCGIGGELARCAGEPDVESGHIS